MHLSFLRDYHEARVIALARATPAVERGTLAETTGLTPQAVSKVLGRLLDEGILAPAGVRRPALGKPAATYRLVPESRWAIGAHVTRRALRLALTDLAGAIRVSSTSPLPPDFRPSDLLAALSAGVTQLVTGHRIDPERLVGVGIGMVGPLDQRAGVVRDAHGLRHWHDVPLRELAEQALGRPVLVDKDVTAGVTAEAWRRGPDFHDAALVMVESGIGAGLWLGGAAHRGAHTNAGEFGHAVIERNGPRCVCGRRGCLEVVHDRAGDPKDKAAVLAVGVINLLQTLDLQAVVLAGADLLKHGRQYRAVVHDAVRTQIPRADWLGAEVALTGLGTEVIAAGAAMQVLNERYGVPKPV